MSHRISFTIEELIELERALRLISQEDANCRVNMDFKSRRAKRLALKKLQKITGEDRLTKALRNATSVSITDLLRKVS